MSKISAPSIAAIFTAFVLTGSLVGFGAYTFVSQPPKVPRDLHACATNKQLESATAILVDFTDPPSPAHLTHLETAIPAVRRTTPVDGKALIFLLDPSKPGAVAPVLEVCNPGARGGVAFPEHPSAASQDQEWHRQYFMPFDAALEAARRSPLSRDNSPIFEGITQVSHRADFGADIRERRLIVLSDGLQITPGIFSCFKAGKDFWSAYQRSGLPALTQANLQGVDVEFVYLLRENEKTRNYAQHQTKAHREFLRRWFMDHGAKSVTFTGMGTS